MTASEQPVINDRPLVGVGIAIIRNGKILLGKRKNAHGEGEWAFPGGHLEYGEEVEVCARREAIEETGLKLGKCVVGPYTNSVFHSRGKHYVTLILIAESPVGEAINREPEKCEYWEWFDWNNLPSPLFLPLRTLVENNFNPLDYLPSS